MSSKLNSMASKQNKLSYACSFFGCWSLMTFNLLPKGATFLRTPRSIELLWLTIRVSLSLWRKWMPNSSIWWDEFEYN